ncbi:uncharacterized protein C8Q71DRAFT_712788 [Rhodofomes roseus]|uniref:Pinin/SDK/MemA protein domain-containing protein n=1 Tax=Rhodofomes roseus TaxID=34475 RepID=A0ABQ8K849_9APHY|nr:uncharacterized protein C8Q71DRAFT_712788 [Rhodofomes roseus]KAH9833439.1 hypothetical protein C8Q71DRAFT_712788 [Rhodofomes roseus]
MVDSANTQGGEESTKTGRKRPRIDMATEAGQRKRGKSMFALALGTLTKAKNEDRQRGQSDAAKKRQEIEQRLQDKLRKETDSVRRAEEAKKDKTASNRKEEELQLKDSIYKLRRTRLPLLANFLLTSDNIPDIPLTDPPSLPEPPQDPDNTNLAAATARASKAPALAGPPRSHPPPLYYLPVILTPAQEAFLKQRKEEVKAAAEAEWSAFAAERSAGITEIARLRERVVEEASRSKGSKPQEDVELSDATAAPSSPEKPAEESKPETEALKGASAGSAAQDGASPVKEDAEDAKMEVDDEAAKEGERREKPAPPPPADEDDAVEY